MAPRIIKVTQELAKKIKSRRNELGLTIEEIALRAGVGSKTWSRYESGESIRADKYKGVCKALNWNSLSNNDSNDIIKKSINEYKNHEAWSSFLEKTYGEKAALAFAIGSDILSDHIQEDLDEISSKSKGTHIGELGVSWLMGELPEQFLMFYNYEFLYHIKCLLNQMRGRAKSGVQMIAHSVMEELIFYLCNDEAIAYFEITESEVTDDDDFDIQDWIFDLFGDMDIITFLYSNDYLYSDHPFHFSHWFEKQFYTEVKDATIDEIFDNFISDNIKKDKDSKK